MLTSAPMGAMVAVRRQKDVSPAGTALWNIILADWVVIIDIILFVAGNFNGDDYENITAAAVVWLW